jgi:YesN/AraC family two-component response regulator
MNPVFDGVSRERFEKLYHELWQVIARKPPAYEATAHAVLSAMLAELFAARARDRGLIKSSESAAAVSEKVRMALDFVARLYTENIGLKHFAEAVHLNVHHFSRKFRQEVGTSPIQYLYRFRVEQAKRLLADTARPVGEIARLVGIPDQRYFVRLFQKHTGDSPHAFRKKEREGKAPGSESTPHSRQKETKLRKRE